MVALKVKEKKVRYDDGCDIGQECSLEVDLKDMAKPILVYYQLGNFYQNHRLYVRSRSFEQLRGMDMAEDELKDCDPARTAGDMDVYKTLDESPLKSGDVANPCGLVAKSYFNGTGYLDTFALLNADLPINIKDEGIAFKSDTENLYSRTDNYVYKQWTDVEDGDS